LRAAIGWSYDLLDPPTRTTFERSAFFAGAARWRRRRPSAASTPSTASPHSSSTACSPAATAASRCSRPCREYALDRLAPAARLDARAAPTRATRRHASRAASADGERRDGDWLDRLDADRENVRAAIAFAVADGDAETALALCADVWRYWSWRGNLTEGRETLGAALGLGGGPPRCASARSTAPARSRASRATSRRAKALFERGLALARELGDDYRAARVERQPRHPRALRARLRRGDRALRALDGLHALDRRAARAEPDAAEPRHRPRRRGHHERASSC
jgi:hypothetical protein